MIKSGLAQIKDQMRQMGVDAYLVPTTDPHQSEYVPECWQRRPRVSGFTGSAGDLLITLGESGLWTDSRYFLQAEQQLEGTGIRLFKMGQEGVPSIKEYLGRELHPGQCFAMDPRLISYQEARAYTRDLNDKGVKVRWIEENLVDMVLGEEPMPLESLQVHPTKFAGESVTEKLGRIREAMQEQRVDVHVLTTLDSIAWTFNIRGDDVLFNPVAIAYAMIHGDGATLFVDPQKVTDAVRDHLKDDVEIAPYAEFGARLLDLARQNKTFWLDPETVSMWIVHLLGDISKARFSQSPVTRFKARKNEAELEGFRQAHVRDGVAMVRFLKWLEESLAAGDEITEISAAERLLAFRAEASEFRGPSFETISGYAAHGAIVHYAATPETDVPLQAEGIYLVDSGGQYLDGTTDITRTVALGEPTEEQKDRFTRILMGHIDLTMARFPVGTKGIQLDTLARKPLWDIGENYGHGTGHGVGSYLNVHEGPQGISFYRAISVPLEEGMVCSNEPGFYKAGEYGMRVENLVVVKPDERPTSGDFRFLGFENLTLCPIQSKLINPALMTPDQITFLDHYHAEVRQRLSPLLDAPTREWLEQATRPIEG